MSEPEELLDRLADLPVRPPDFAAVRRRHCRRRLRQGATGLAVAGVVAAGLVTVLPGSGPSRAVVVPAFSPSKGPQPPPGAPSVTPSATTPGYGYQPGVVAAAYVDPSTVLAVAAVCPAGAAACRYQPVLSRDGGASWTPGTPFGELSDLGGWHLTVAGSDAWLWGTSMAQVWASHDGGRSWRLQPGVTGPVAGAAVTGSTVTFVTSARPTGTFGCFVSCRTEVDVAPVHGGTAQRVGVVAARGAGVQSVAWAGAGTAYALTAAAPVGPTRLWVTGDAGRTWTARSAPACPAFGDTLAVWGSDQLWLLCGDQPEAGTQRKQLWRSADGGRSWHRLPDPGMGGNYVTLTLTGIGAAWRSGSGPAPVLRTTDGGQTWRPQPVGVSTGNVWAFAATGERAVAFVHYQAWVTSNGGGTWTRGADAVRAPAGP